MQAKTKGGALSAETFLAGLALQAKQGCSSAKLLASGMVDLVNLEEAADRLSWRYFHARYELENPPEGKAPRYTPRQARSIIREVLADIDEHTKGAPYRFDTPHGPLFNFDPLFVAAGRCGGHMGDKGKDEPTWPRAAQRLRAVAA